MEGFMKSEKSLPINESQIPKELEEKIKEAMNEDIYFITISKKMVGENLDLRHYWNCKKMSKEDVLQCLDEITKDYKSKKV
jgi:hypothetical protein